MQGNLLSFFLNLFFTSLGSALLYSTWGRKQLKIYLLSDLMIALHLSEDQQIIWGFLIFLFFGCSISLGIVHPQTATQAFSAGLGWTGLVGRPRK